MTAADGAFAFMLSSLWATLQITFVGVTESARRTKRRTKRRNSLTPAPSARATGLGVLREHLELPLALYSPGCVEA